MVLQGKESKNKMEKQKDNLEMNDYESWYNESQKDLLNICRRVLEHLPREMLIKELRRRKIIERDWNEKGIKYKLKDEK